MNQSLHSAQLADDVAFFFFFFHARKKKKKHRTDALFIGPRPFSFAFFFFITFYRATSWLRAYPLLKWSSTIFLPFFFHATSWLRADTLLNRSSTIFLPFFFSTPPHGSEQTRCSIGPRPFIPLLRHLVAQSRHAAQSLLTIFFNNYPLLFPFDAASWLNRNKPWPRPHAPRPSQGASKKKGVNGIANFSHPEQKIRNSSQILQTLIHKYKREQQQKKHNIKQQPIPQHLRNRTAASPKE